MDLTLDVASVHVTQGYSTKEVRVEIQGASPSDVLESLSIKDVVSHFPIADLLDEIGEKEAKNHFNLIDAE